MINKVILIGNVGQDPVTTYLDSGVAVSKFSVATSESYTNKNGEKITNTEWHNCVAWRKLAENIEKYVKKGQQLYLEGKLTHRSYEDKDGVKKYITEVVVYTIKFLGGKKEKTESSNTVEVETTDVKELETKNTDTGASDGGEDDLPFILTIPIALGFLAPSLFETVINYI